MARAPASSNPTPVRPPELPQGRWLGDLQAIRKLSPAEERLLQCCAKGEVWVPNRWNGNRPEKPTAANTIRADLVRFLALGGDMHNPVHEEGVMLRGGWISGGLDLQQCKAPARLDLRKCEFVGEPILTAASLPELVFCGSRVPGLTADRLKVMGNIFLNDGFEAKGEVRLLSAEIGGNLECSGGKFTDLNGDALTADGMILTGDVVLQDGFEAQGEVRLLGARIGGNLVCSGGKFIHRDGFALACDRMTVAGDIFLHGGFQAQGVVRLLGAKIGGDLACSGGEFTYPVGDALDGNGMTVKGAVFLRKSTITGAINFAGAQFGTLIDDADCWGHRGHTLDGLRYESIVGPLDAPGRIAWLQTQRADQLDNRDFKPQPWEQLIKVLREMGHSGEAAEVAIAKQDAMRSAGRIEGPLRRPLHWLYGALAGYGYRPLRAFIAMFCLFLASAFFFQIGADYGYMGPSTPLLNNADVSSEVAATCGHAREAGKKLWTVCSAMPPEYTTFQPLLYSLDLILPLVDLQQEADWAPIVQSAQGDTLGYGTFLRWLMWFEILFGWTASLMLVAILGRLVDKD